MVVLRFTSRRGPVDRQTFDRAYVERLRAGDAETERHFFAYFSELIVIKARARRAVDVDDIRQETMLRVLRRARELGKRRLCLGMGASLEKRRFGARAWPRCVYFQATDHYHLEVLAQLEADRGAA